MAGIKGATAHNAKITFDGLMALLRSHPGKGFAVADLVDHFNCGFSAANQCAHRLMLTGAIHRTRRSGRGSLNIYHVGRLVDDGMRLAPVVPVERYVGEVVPPRTFNAWTPPMRGYDASLRAVAERALATRSA